jgi:hypothetical protein
MPILSLPMCPQYWHASDVGLFNNEAYAILKLLSSQSGVENSTIQSAISNHNVFRSIYEALLFKFKD